MSYPGLTNTGNYIVYETGLVVPPGAENISFNFVGIEIENEIEEMIELRKNLFKSKAYGLKIPYNFSYDINNKIDLEISKMIFRFRKK